MYINHLSRFFEKIFDKGGGALFPSLPLGRVRMPPETAAKKDVALLSSRGERGKRRLERGAAVGN